MRNNNNQVKSEMPQKHKSVAAKVTENNRKPVTPETSETSQIRNEPSDPRQIGSSIVRRNEADDED